MLAMSYAEARDQVDNSDIALFRGTDAISYAIAKATGMPESHVGLLWWPGASDVLMIAEAMELRSWAVEFSSRVQAHSGQWDVYSLRPELAADVNLAKVVELCLRATNVNYPENWLFLDAMHILFPNSPAVKPIPNSNDPKTPRHCSGLLAWAFREAGLPPLKPEDCYVYPGDWADPKVTQYKFTLTWP